MTQEQSKKILVRTRLTESEEIIKFRELAKVNRTTTYQLGRNLIHTYLQQNSPTV